MEAGALGLVDDEREMTMSRKAKLIKMRTQEAVATVNRSYDQQQGISLAAILGIVALVVIYCTGSTPTQALSKSYWASEGGQR